MFPGAALGGVSVEVGRGDEEEECVVEAGRDDCLSPRDKWVQGKEQRFIISAVQPFSRG